MVGALFHSDQHDQIASVVSRIVLLQACIFLEELLKEVVMIPLGPYTEPGELRMEDAKIL